MNIRESSEWYKMKVTEKISRISWNSNDWVKPSGRKGKSINPQTFEGRYGYGYEEWLFDLSKTIDNYHYGFLQPLHLKTDKHVGKSYKIWLYTFMERRKILVGSIENAICISKNESKEIYKTYKEKKWLNEMIKDLIDVNINPDNFKEMPSCALFNIKFKSENLDVYNPYRILANNDLNVTTLRFKLLNKRYDF